MGYPRMLQKKSDGSCPGVTGIGAKESDFLDGLADDVNSHIISAVSLVRSNHPLFDIRFVDMNNYITKGACWSSSEREVNDKVLGGHASDWFASHASFHPHQRGYDQYLAA